MFYAQITGQLLVMGYVLYRFAAPFLKKADKKGAACAGAAYSLAMLLLYMLPRQMDVFAAYGIGCLSAFFVMCRIERRNYEQKLFLVVTFFSLLWPASAMAEILYDHLYSFAEHTEYMAKHLNMWLALYACVCMFYLAAEFLFLRISTWCITKAYVYKYADMEKKELIMLSVPSFMGVTGYALMQHYRIFYITENGEASGIYDMLAFFYYAVSVIVIVVIIILYQSIKAGQEEKLQNELLAAQIDNTKKHIEQVESLYQHIRSIKHDMANHVLTLERLYAGNKTEEAKAYGTEVKNALSEMTGEIKSGNPVTDVILQEVKNKAEKKQIRFQSDFHYPTGSGINAFDISVVLNNALQNAMENVQACGSKTPYISILSYRRNNAYMIEISSSFAGELQWDTESGLPVTSKENKAGHGYGLANIRRVAGKYSGDIAIDLQGGEFRLSIMLMAEG